MPAPLAWMMTSNAFPHLPERDFLTTAGLTSVSTTHTRFLLLGISLTAPNTTLWFRAFLTASQPKASSTVKSPSMQEKHAVPEINRLWWRNQTNHMLSDAVDSTLPTSRR